MKKRPLDEYLERDYPVEIRAIPKELGGGYLASIPCLGRGAFSAEGETPSEALQNLEKVKEVLFQDMLERGKRIPPPPPLPEEETADYSGRILLRLPKWLHMEIVQRAQENDCSINQYVNTVLSKRVGAEECAETVLKALRPEEQLRQDPYVVRVPSAKTPLALIGVSEPEKLLPDILGLQRRASYGRLL